MEGLDDNDDGEEDLFFVGDELESDLSAVPSSLLEPRVNDGTRMPIRMSRSPRMRLIAL